MPTLFEQINQMIDALEVVDPQAAAVFRGGQARRPTNIYEYKAALQTTLPSQGSSAGAASSKPVVLRAAPSKPAASPALQKQNTGMPNQNQAARIDSFLEGSKLDPLRIGLTDSLIKGIIYSEILGKPVSRRRGHGRVAG